MDGWKDECLNIRVYYSIMGIYRFLPKIKYKPQIRCVKRKKEQRTDEINKKTNRKMVDLTHPNY